MFLYKDKQTKQTNMIF